MMPAQPRIVTRFAVMRRVRDAGPISTGSEPWGRSSEGDDRYATYASRAAAQKLADVENNYEQSGKKGAKPYYEFYVSAVLLTYVEV